MDWQRIQKVFRVCSSQERFFVRLGRNLSYQNSGMGAHYAAHPLHKRWSELAFLFTVGGFSENQDRFLNDG